MSKKINLGILPSLVWPNKQFILRLCLNLNDNTTIYPWYFQPKPKVPRTKKSVELLVYGSKALIRLQNQPGEPSNIRLSKQQSSKNRFSFLKLACCWHFPTMLAIGNFGSLRTDGFFNWFWTLWCINALRKWESLWNFWFGLWKPGVDCDI